MTHLSVQGAGKAYGPIRALFNASLSIQSGEIHALVGENGAGKSTLLKIAAGHVSPDHGSVILGGVPLSPHTPHEALRRGVSLVAQHFTLVGAFTVLENIVLGNEPLSHGRIDFPEAGRRIANLEAELHLKLDVSARTDSLGVGAKQRVELVRALYRGSRVLLLDEPTAVLAKGEADALYALLRRLARSGYAICVTTHKLDEVVDHADVTTVLRKGEVVVQRQGATREELTRAIMGGVSPEPVKRRSTAHGSVVLKLGHVTKGRALSGLSLEVRAGEIVGIAGVEGNGQREIALLLARLAQPDGGTIAIGALGKDDAAVVHEDRQREGLVLSAQVSENLMLGELQHYTARGLIDTQKLMGEASRRDVAAGIVPPNLEVPASSLSGGNQQKIVVARALAHAAAPLLVLSHPTRGVDVGAATAIHRSILSAAETGKGVLVISSDLPELRTLCDRILVIASGRIAGEFQPDADDVTLGRAMLVSHEPEATFR